MKKTDQFGLAEGLEALRASKHQQKEKVKKSKLVTDHDPVVLKQLRVLAAEESTTQQRLVAEGLNMVFAKYGKPQIA